MRKLFILQELITNYEGKFWFDIISDSDLDIINQYFEVFDRKYLDRTYRVIEVIQ